MKKGFTLVELLGVLVIISLVSLIVTPKVTELFHKKQLEASESFKETVFLATRQYITNNEYKFNTSAPFYCVTVGDLIEKGELAEPVVDVATGNKIDNETNVEVVVDENSNYNLTYNTERCSQGDINAPVISVQRAVSADKTSVTLTINAIDDSPLADLPYSFDGGTTWQASNQKVINDAFSATLKVKDKYDNMASIDYCISKLTIDASGGVWNSLTDLSVYWLEKEERMTMANPIKLGNTFGGWDINNSTTMISGTTLKMGSANTKVTAKWSLTQYTLTVNINDGVWAGSTSQILTIGQTVIIDDPKKLGNVFGGWTMSGTGSTMNGTTFTMGTANTTLSATWYTYANMYTYTGVSEVIDDGDYNWRIKFKTSGTLNFKVNAKFDIFLVGGGSSLGGSGYTKTYTTLSLNKNTNYSIVVGAGGTGGADGTASTAFDKTANPGSGCNGGSGCGESGYTWNGGAGGSDGSGGGSTGSAGEGTGQGTTTREFGESTGTLYAGAGGGGGGFLTTVNPDGSKTYYTFYGGAGGAGGGGTGASTNSGATGGTPNTGGGGGLGIRGVSATSGGSGIVIMRNSRVLDIYTYTGDSIAINDGDGNWRIKLLTSGTFTPKVNLSVDIFLVGGGGGSGTCSSDSSGGAGGGYTLTQKTLSMVAGTAYPVTIGSGGTNGSRGGSTTLLGQTAVGGYSNSGNTGGNGGSGGGYGGPWTGSYYCCAGDGGSDGNSNGANCASSGSGQGTTTKEFGEANGTLYGGGGGGYGGYNSPCGNNSKSGGIGGGGNSGQSGATNTGGGGGACATGGAGIAIIRNTR